MSQVVFQGIRVFSITVVCGVTAEFEANSALGFLNRNQISNIPFNDLISLESSAIKTDMR